MTAALPQRLSDCLVLVFDTETTGVQVSADRIVELGAVYLEHGRVQKPPYRMLVNPGVPIPPESSEIHGIRDSHVENAPTFAEVGGRFLTHLSGAARGGPPPVLAGYNAARFDAALVNAELARHGLEGHIDPERVVDPFVFMKWHHRNLRGRKLSDACAHYEVRLTNAHSAAADAVASGELLLRMVQAGRMPDDVEAALAAQRDFVRLIDEEMETWRHWIYRDRDDGQTLRLGAGKPVGTPLDRVDAGWYRFVLETVQDLPEAARAEFTRHVR